MLINEFRESVDIDFLCASADGYADLRGLIFDSGIAPLFREARRHSRAHCAPIAMAFVRCC